jgi:hypothetical protein
MVVDLTFCFYLLCNNCLTFFVLTLVVLWVTWQVRASKVAEWWAHIRPHSSGHQLHFDTDEQYLHMGQGIRTPSVSTVCYLGPDQRVGGPTVVFDHKAGGGPSGGKGKDKGEGKGEAGLAREAVLVDPR